MIRHEIYAGGLIIGIIIGIIIAVIGLFTLAELSPHQTAGVVTSVKPDGSNSSRYIITVMLPDGKNITQSIACKTFNLGTKVNVTVAGLLFSPNLNLPKSC